MNINISGHAGTETSYGIVTNNIIKALQKLNHNVALFPIGNPAAQPEDVDNIKAALESAKLYDAAAPTIRLWHQFDLASTVGRGPRVAYPIFELDKFTPQEKHHLSNQDCIIVCSKWAKKVIEDNGITVPTYVAPLGTNDSIFNENVKPLVPKGRKTIFLNINKIEKRKGHFELIRAFNDAFVPSDNVELWMCWHNPFLKTENIIKWEQLYLDSNMGKAGKIKILTPLIKAADPPYQMRIESPRKLASIMASADCFVSPHFAEGWALSLGDSARMGLHIIASNYSAPTEYLNNDNARLITIRDTEPAHDGVWFHGAGNWAKFDDDAYDMLVNHMRDIHKLKQSGQLNLNVNGINHIKNNFTWDNTARAIEAALTDLGVK